MGTARELSKTYLEFQELQPVNKPELAHKFLKGIRVGTVICSTAANTYFGLEEGREVKLHIISFGTFLSTLEFQDLHNYSTYIQEIITCINDSRNSDILKSVLLPMFIEKTSDVAATDRDNDQDKPIPVAASVAAPPVSSDNCQNGCCLQ